MQTTNPTGTDGFAFLEFSTNDTPKLIDQFARMGFVPVAKHKDKDITLYKQNDIHFIINNAHGSLAEKFAAAHGAAACAMGFRVKDAKTAFKHAVKMGAQPYAALGETPVYDIPAIHGVGGSLIYFVDEKDSSPNFMKHFSDLAPTAATQQKPIGLTTLITSRIIYIVAT